MDTRLVESYLDVLRRIGTGLSAQESFRDTLGNILSLLAKQLGFERPHIVVQDPESLDLRLSLAYGQADAHVAYAPGRGITGQVFASGQPLLVPCMRDHPDFRNRLFERTEKELGRLAFLCVPVRADESSEVLGTLSADTPRSTKEELELQLLFLEVVASIIGRHVACLQDDLAKRHFQLYNKEEELPRFPSIIGSSAPIRTVLRQIMQVAPSRATVLVRGESGTGKELMAEALHRSSPRRNRPFVTLNCAALPPELLEGELFGWRKGAFTNAIQNHRGLFEQADGGTLFLDEIGDLALPAQAKVLRALQERQIQCLGSEHIVTVDVRLVCATNRPLEDLVRQGLFREDLYYRINVFPILMPALRERREDIPRLATHFLRLFGEEYGRSVTTISEPAMQALTAYTWAGNVRELKNIIERAVLVCDESTVRMHHLPTPLRGEGLPLTTYSGAGLTEAVGQLEQEMITNALTETDGNIHEAARRLKVTYRILYYKLKKYGIDYRSFGTPEVVQ